MVDAKICGLNDAGTLAMAVDAGAALVGFNFYPPSPRAVTAEAAAQLAATLPPGIKKVGLFVDPSDDDIATVLGRVDLDIIQLHGSESPARVAEIRRGFGRPVMKAVKIASRADLAETEAYDDAADMLLLDAKAPNDLADALPGGNGLTFDWNLIRDRRWRLPWMLAGGLDDRNVAEAVRISGADIVDVSSGVESAPGSKDPALIKAFLDAVKRL